MSERKIKKSLKNAVDQAPIDILENLKSHQVERMEEHDDITRQTPKKSIMIKRFIPFTVAAAAFIGIFFHWQSSYVWADSQVYFDVNPSIRITTNKNDKVIGMNGINQEAKQIIERMDYKGKTIIQVTEDLMDQLLEKNYLTETDKYILLSVYNKKTVKAEEQRLEIDEAIHRHLKTRDLNPVVLNQAIEQHEDPNITKLDDSKGRATLIKKLTELAPNLKADILKEMSIQELVFLARAFDIELLQLFDSQDFEAIEAEDIGNLEFENDGSIVPKKPSTTPRRISSEEAKKIALKKVDGTIVDFELDDDEYEVEIHANGKEYEITIDAYTGKIIEFKVDDLDDDKPATKPATKPVTKPVTKPTTKPTTKPATKAERISAATAKEIALKKVNGTIVDFELDDDEYEVEIHAEGKEYEMTIDAYTGKITQFEVDDQDDEPTLTTPKKTRITSEQAKKIALAKVNGTIVDFELDDDEYKVEIHAEGKEYEMIIDAYTGEITEFEIDD